MATPSMELLKSSIVSGIADTMRTVREAKATQMSPIASLVSEDDPEGTKYYYAPSGAFACLIEMEQLIFPGGNYKTASHQLQEELEYYVNGGHIREYDPVEAEREAQELADAEELRIKSEKDAADLIANQASMLKEQGDQMQAMMEQMKSMQAKLDGQTEDPPKDPPPEKTEDSGSGGKASSLRKGK